MTLSNGTRWVFSLFMTLGVEGPGSNLSDSDDEDGNDDDDDDGDDDGYGDVDRDGDF